MHIFFPSNMSIFQIAFFQVLQIPSFFKNSISSAIKFKTNIYAQQDISSGLKFTEKSN